MLDISSNAIHLLSLTIGAVLVDRIGMCPLCRAGGTLLGLADVPLFAGPTAANEADLALAFDRAP